MRLRVGRGRGVGLTTSLGLLLMLSGVGCSEGCSELLAT